MSKNKNFFDELDTSGWSDTIGDVYTDASGVLLYRDLTDDVEFRTYELVDSFAEKDVYSKSFCDPKLQRTVKITIQAGNRRETIDTNRYRGAILTIESKSLYSFDLEDDSTNFLIRINYHEIKSNNVLNGYINDTNSFEGAVRYHDIQLNFEYIKKFITEGVETIVKNGKGTNDVDVNEVLHILFGYLNTIVDDIQK